MCRDMIFEAHGRNKALNTRIAFLVGNVCTCERLLTVSGRMMTIKGLIYSKIPSHTLYKCKASLGDEYRSVSLRFDN